MRSAFTSTVCKVDSDYDIYRVGQKSKPLLICQYIASYVKKHCYFACTPTQDNTNKLTSAALYCTGYVGTERCSYSLVWDNTQKSVVARDQSHKGKNKMMMWANVYAAKSRAPCSLETQTSTTATTLYLVLAMYVALPYKVQH